MSSTKNKSFYSWIKAFLIAFAIVLLINFLLFDTYTIPSSSMEKTLLPGDVVMVAKYKYGSRLPNTLLSIPFSNAIYSDFVELPYIRIPGTSSVKNLDVVVFNYPNDTAKPVDKRTCYIKRCVGIAGDTLEIINSKIFVNRKELPEPLNAEFSYIVKTNGMAFNQQDLDKMSITEGGPLGERNTFNFFLTRQSAEKLSTFSNVKSIEPFNEKIAIFNEAYFPSYPLYNWNDSNYGQIVIPKKGQKIHLNANNICFYEKIIGVYERNKLNISGDSIFINDKPATEYIFKMNYYFMMGDNRQNSADSRYWGFVPEDHIIGKAIMILFSIDNSRNIFNGFRWSRFCKTIH